MSAFLIHKSLTDIVIVHIHKTLVLAAAVGADVRCGGARALSSSSACVEVCACPPSLVCPVFAYSG